MQCSIKLIHNDSVFPWYKTGNVSVCGYAFSENTNSSYGSNDTFGWFSGASLAALFSAIGDESSFKRLISRLNGSFSVIIEKESFIAFGVDRLRVFPLFYLHNEESFLLTNHLKADPELLNKNKIEEFEALYFTAGADTLLGEWKQLTAGTFGWIDKVNSTFHVEDYYLHRSRDKYKIVECTSELISEIHERVIQRQVKSTDGLPVAILLSGGYDSRWLIASWQKYHHGPLYAISYGKPESYDTMAAAHVAEKLGVKHLFIEYNEERLSLFGDADWQAYAAFNHNAVSVPYEQDYFAIRYVKEHGLIPHNTVIVPGFCGDLLGGSIFDIFPHQYNFEGLAQFITEKYYHTCTPELPQEIGITDKYSFWDAWQHWFVVNRVSKFLVNGVRAYSHFGYSWRLPLWDYELMDFWYKVPLEARIDQQLYNKWLFEQVFNPASITAIKPAIDANTNNLKWKETLKKILPKAWVNAYRSGRMASGLYDPNNLLFLYNKVNKELEKPVLPPTYNFNDVHARSVLQKNWGTNTE